MNLPELRLIDKIGNDYLFEYKVDGAFYFCMIKEEGPKNYKIEIGTKPNQIIMVIEKESRMGKDIRKELVMKLNYKQL